MLTENTENLQLPEQDNASPMGFPPTEPTEPTEPETNRFSNVVSQTTSQPHPYFPTTQQLTNPAQSFIPPAPPPTHTNHNQSPETATFLGTTPPHNPYIEGVNTFTPVKRPSKIGRPAGAKNRNPRNSSNTSPNNTPLLDNTSPNNNTLHSAISNIHAHNDIPLANKLSTLLISGLPNATLLQGILGYAVKKLHEDSDFNELLDDEMNEPLLPPQHLRFNCNAINYLPNNSLDVNTKTDYTLELGVYHYQTPNVMYVGKITTVLNDIVFTARFKHSDVSKIENIAKKAFTDFMLYVNKLQCTTWYIEATNPVYPEFITEDTAIDLSGQTEATTEEDYSKYFA